MKKYLLVVPVLALTFASCKKDRVCSCKVVQSYTGTYTGDPADKPKDSVYDYKVTMVDVSLKTGNKACVHTKTEDKNYGDGLTEVRDSNCSLE